MQCYLPIREQLPEESLNSHLNKEYGIRKYTSKADDWELYFTLACESIDIARKIEQHIKKMKSRTYITNLLIYKEVSEKLLQRFGDQKNCQ